MPDIAYSIHGAPSAHAPLLLTHGFGASQAMWAPNLDALGADRQVVTWDLPGHGATAGSDEFSHDECIADMLGVLDAIGATRAVIGGMSLGGYLSLLFSVRHPERVAALLLVDTGPGFRDDSAREAWNKRARGLADELEAGGLAVLGRNAETVGAEHAAGADGLAAAARSILTQHNAEVLESLGAIAIPTLVVVGEHDERFLAAAQMMARRIPDAREVIIEDAGHAANMDQPAPFNRTVREFLEEL
jgi:pimeloyl-ACP methyl ester carboxylesterase